MGQLCLKERNLGAENDSDVIVEKRKVLRSNIKVAFQMVGTQRQFFCYSALRLSCNTLPLIVVCGENSSLSRQAHIALLRMCMHAHARGPEDLNLEQICNTAYSIVPCSEYHTISGDRIDIGSEIASSVATPEMVGVFHCWRFQALRAKMRNRASRTSFNIFKHEDHWGTTF